VSGSGKAFEYADLIGTPFKYGGRPGESRELDCYGLVIECARRMGQILPERQFAERKEVIAFLMATQMDEWQRVDPEPGAIVLFKIRNVASHVGVMIDEFNFLHTWERSGGVCRERIEDWEQRVEGYYRYTGGTKQG
jgi:cell wall-associated NlpC family hydrolase